MKPGPGTEAAATRVHRAPSSILARHAWVPAALALGFAPGAPVAGGAGPAGATRPLDIELGGAWAFAYTPAHTATVPDARAFSTSMPVPGCWDDHVDPAQARALWPDATFNAGYRPIRYPMEGKPPDASLPYLVGTGWYRRQATAPADWRGNRVTLRVGRVVMEAWVHVNGREAHHHLGHSTDWEADLTPHLRWGATNEIVIAVDNTRTDRIGCVIRGWQGRSAGIFGPVSLHVAGEARIADVYVHPHQDALRWRVELEGAPPADAELRWQVEGAGGGTHPAATDADRHPTRVEWATDTAGMRPWSDRDPKLHDIEVSLWSGTRQLDIRRQRFGLRRLTTHGTALRLNGRPIYLRGACDSAYFPESCTPPTDVEWYRRHLRRLKDVGFNWVRCHTWVPLEPHLRAADEIGMLIQVEPPAGHELTEWTDIVRACRKHPSVVLYCCGNEETLDETKIVSLRERALVLHDAAPDALFNPHSALRGVEYGWARNDRKPGAQEPFPHDPTRLNTLREFSDVFGQYAWGWASYTSLQGDPDRLDARLAIYGRPCMTHELGICGCYLDLALEPRYRGTRIGPDLYAGAREALRRAGLLERAAMYHRNSAAWQRLMLKDAVETVRHCRLLTGYDMLGAKDTHWHRTGYGCGILNEFDELKPGRTIEEILSWNGESVLLISDQRSRNLRAGQPLRRDLALSWFGPGPLRNAPLRCELRAADCSLIASADTAIASVAPGTLTRILALDLPTPTVRHPLKTTLSVSLAAPEGAIRNSWDFWIFPDSDPTPRPDILLIVRALDRPALTTLAAGGRVLLLGHAPFPSRPMGFQMGLAGRPEGNLATVIAPHPLLDGFPHGGYCDWQFARMLDGAHAVGFDAMPAAAFDPLLEIVSSYKQIRKQAALFEWRVGPGRLLVCSLNLQETDPAAAHLRARLLAYAAGDGFRPRAAVPADWLAQLADRGAVPPSRAAPDTDRAFDERAQKPGAATRPPTDQGTARDGRPRR